MKILITMLTVIFINLQLYAVDLNCKNAAISIEKKVSINNGNLDNEDGLIYCSKLKGEKLFHIRIFSGSEHPTYIFMGAKPPLDSNDTDGVVRIYEFTPPNNLHVIDSFPLTAFHSEWIINENGVYFDQWVLRNYDNLVLDNDKLLYYRELNYPIDDENTKIKFNRQKVYNSYKIGSLEKAQEITKSEFNLKNNRKTLRLLESMNLSPNKEIAVFTDIYNIYFHYMGDMDREELFRYSDSKDAVGLSLYDSAKGDFNILTFFPDIDPNSFCDENALFGSMHWHPNGDILFFDNSGICYACIWMINLKTQTVKKLVPEHEAIHPWFSIRNGQEFLAYVQGDEIREIKINLDAPGYN